MDKKSKNTLIVSIIALVLVLIGVTYAYFSARITGLESASTISLTAGRMGIVYSEDDASVIANNIYPRSEEWITKTITLTGYNTTDKNMYYDLGLQITSNTFLYGELTFDLTGVGSNGAKIADITGQSITKASGFFKFGTGAFNTANGDQHVYTLKIYFKDTGEDQNYNQEAIFNGKIDTRESTLPENECFYYQSNVVSYDIDYDACMEFVQDDDNWGLSAQDAATYCSGNDLTIYHPSEGEFTANINDDIMVDPDFYEGEGVIYNIVYSEPTLVELQDNLYYPNGQYYYMYNSIKEGWSVHLADGTSTEPITTRLCTSINGKPIYSMNSLFSNSKATSVDLSSFNTSSITNMYRMFANSEFISVDLSNFDTSNVTNMSSMFEGSKIVNLDLSSFDTSNVTDVEKMFYNSSSTSINVSSFDTSNLTSLKEMFMNSKVTNLDLTSFNLSKVNNMTSMFEGSYIEKVTFLKNEKTAPNTSLSVMFRSSKATTLDLSDFFDTSNVSEMYGMFGGSQVVNLDLTSFNTSSLTSLRSTFYNCQATTIDQSTFDTSKVTDMLQLFSYSPNLTTIYTSDKFVVTAYSSTTSPMFVNCTNLVGGAGTTYNSSRTSKFWANIDNPPDNPGYFTRKS